MKVRISKFSSHQTAKVLALMMAITSFLMLLLMLLLSAVFGGQPESSNVETVPPLLMLPMLVLMPLIQALFGYLIARVGLFVYNRLAKSGIGFEFELQELTDPEPVSGDPQ